MRSVEIAVNRDRRYLPVSGIAIDFGGTKIAAARIDDSRVVDIVRAQTRGDDDVEAQVDKMCALLDQLSLGTGDVVGIAVSGRVSRDGVWYAVNAETLSGIDAVPLKALMTERLDRDVIVENDGTAAAIGEFVAGSGIGCRSMAYITISTGVGGGLIVDRRPLVSDEGLAGHVGFTTSSLAAGRCGSGREKTVESVASGRAIAAQAALAGYPGTDARRVFEVHRAGERWASTLIEVSAAAIAELCANLKSVLDPDLIVLGGSIGLAEGYCELVHQSLDAEPPLFRAPVVTAALGQNSALIGILAKPSQVAGGDGGVPRQVSR